MMKALIQNVISYLATKFRRKNTFLSKLRHFTDNKALKPIYHAIFELHLHYCCLVWVQILTSVKRLFVLQKKSLQPIIFLTTMRTILTYSKNHAF